MQNNKIGLPLTYQKQQYGLVPKNPIAGPVEFRVHGVALSRTGKELFNVMDIEPVEAYTTALINFFESQGYILTLVNVPSS